jgi:hypothetical protein
MGSRVSAKMASAEKLSSLVVIIPNNPDFEIIRKLEMAKLNKAVSYLRWVRNRFRISRCDIRPADIQELELWKQSFGCQRSENKFIIWKHVVKWRKYAEILINEKTAYVEGFGRRKKGEKIETIFLCVQKLGFMTKMKEGKLYNVFEKENLDLLIRKTVWKKKTELYCEEEDEEFCLGKFCKDWRTRRKKPPDKIVNVKLSIRSNVVRKKKEKMFKGKRKKRRRKYVNLEENNSKMILIAKENDCLRNHDGKVSYAVNYVRSIVKKANVGENAIRTMTCKYRSLEEKVQRTNGVEFGIKF